MQLVPLNKRNRRRLLVLAAESDAPLFLERRSKRSLIRMASVECKIHSKWGAVASGIRLVFYKKTWRFNFAAHIYTIVYRKVFIHVEFNSLRLILIRLIKKNPRMAFCPYFIGHPLIYRRLDWTTKIWRPQSNSATSNKSLPPRRMQTIP